MGALWAPISLPQPQRLDFPVVSDHLLRPASAACTNGEKAMRVLSLLRITSGLVFATFLMPPPLRAQEGVRTRSDEASASFQEAYTDYQNGKFSAAARLLEKLSSEAPTNFETHELLGLTYAADAKDMQATEQFRLAVKLRPRSAAARNNLATSLVHNGKLSDAEAEWRQALLIEPQNYSATRNLAKLYLQQGRLGAALPLLTSARQLRPEAADNNYDLSLAYMMTGHPTEARALIEALLHQSDAGDLHSLLAQLDEEGGRYVDAANEFATAAHIDPSESNLFAWASELLLHRAYEAAISVFRDGTQRFPAAPRLWVGLGMALYSRGEYEPSVHALLTAADLNAEDSRCYLFLSKAYLSSPSQADEVIERFKRYAQLKPNDALSQYYYAMSLWKGRRANAAEINYSAVESLLQRSIVLDPKNAEVHLQLGILFNDEHQYGRSLPEFEAAVRLDPNLSDAHFRLGRYYLRAGDVAKGQLELDRFKALQAQHQAEVDKERAEVQQFVVANPTAPSTHP